MIKNFIRFLYRRYPKVFYECVSEDFLGSIPKRINENALAVFEERRETLQKWFLYQSFIIQRKAVSDIRRADFYLGMLTNIKMYLTLIESDEVKVPKQVIPKKQPREDISKEIGAVEAFRKGLKKDK